MSKSIEAESCRLISTMQSSCQSYAKYSIWRRSESGNEWIRYQEMNVTEDDQSLWVDHFWKKVFTKKDNSGDQFEVL